jgi:hypothetical protein
MVDLSVNATVPTVLKSRPRSIFGRIATGFLVSGIFTSSSSPEQPLASSSSFSWPAFSCS